MEVSMPISHQEFFEFDDEHWKMRVVDFLNRKRETETPAYDVPEIAIELHDTDSRLPDIRRKVEWALEELVNEGHVVKTKVKINDYYYYMSVIE
jgi:hypothetical protein